MQNGWKKPKPAVGKVLKFNNIHICAYFLRVFPTAESNITILGLEILI